MDKSDLLLISFTCSLAQMSSSDRSLVNAFKEIANMGEKINLPRSLLDRANTLFKQVRSRGCVCIYIYIYI